MLVVASWPFRGSRLRLLRVLLGDRGADVGIYVVTR